MNEDRISELLREADCVPEAPDCRAAVMERIRTPERRRRFVWAYACAAVLAAIAGTWTLVPRAERQSPVVKVAKKAPASPRVAESHIEPPAPIKHLTVVPKHVAAVPRPRRVHIVHAPPKQTPQPKEGVVTPQQNPMSAQTPAPPVTAANRPVAIAIVTWPSQAEQESDTQSYSYTDRDARTGQTTECRVKRSGDSVEIYMESKPEAKQPPVKGSIGYETKPSV